MLALSIWVWGQLPPNVQIPTRFNFDGSPTAYMGKEVLLLSPLIVLLVAVTDLILPRTEPNQRNLRRSSKAYTAVSVAIAAVFSSVHVVIILSALGKPVNVAAATNLTIGLFLIIVGNYLSKIRPNHSFGVRTRWTISSDLAWQKTHRLGGWLLVLNGFTFLIAGLSSNVTLLICSIVSLLIISLLVLPIYSYLIWRDDPNRSTS